MDSVTAKCGKSLFHTEVLCKSGQNSDRTGPSRSSSEAAAVSIGTLLYWRQLPQRPDWLWGLAVVSGAFCCR